MLRFFAVYCTGARRIAASGILAACALLAGSAPVRARQAKPDSPRPRAELVAKIEAYRDRLNELVPFYERDLQAAGDRVAKRRALYEEGLVARVDLEDSERALAEVRRKLDETREQITQSGEMIAEARVADELERKQELATGEPVIRFEGFPGWSLAKRSTVEDFFEERFGYELPVSAVGQTALHDRMGFAHYDAMDVAVHPDSAEGKQLMEYLRQAGIPFIAFRTAIAGSATGAHIHVGRPSLRLAVAA